MTSPTPASASPSPTSDSNSTSDSTPSPVPAPASRPAVPSTRLSGKVVVITGAARGLGAALAVKLAEQGARLALVGLETEELANTAAACERARSTSGAPTATWHADVTDRARMTEVADQVLAQFGRVDVVVANAGIALGGPTVESDSRAFDRVVEVNLLGSIATARAFLPALIESKGYLLQIASLAAIAPAPLMAAYCASKAGVEAFAHCLRGEVAHQGVQVGVAYLTWTNTDMVRAADEDPVLREMRARLPWPANKTAPLDPAVARIVNGITGRKAHVYAQSWIRPIQWLPRAAVPTVVARRGAKEVARLASRLHATSHLRQQPLGPGGAAASPPHALQPQDAAQLAAPPRPGGSPEPAAPSGDDAPGNRVANHPPA